MIDYIRNGLGDGDWGLGIGDWGLGIGDWAQSPIPNPQSPIPKNLMNNIRNTKLQLIKFFELYKEFFYAIGVNDDDSFIYLQMYDLFLDCRGAVNDYIESL